MVECKYYSFYALSKINDPELLYQAFQQQIAPGHASEIEVEVFEHSDKRWNRLTRSGGIDQNIPADILEILQQKFGAHDAGSWYYDSDIEGWFCSYKPLTSKHFVLLVKCADPDKLIDVFRNEPDGTVGKQDMNAAGMVAAGILDRHVGDRIVIVT